MKTLTQMYMLDKEVPVKCWKSSGPQLQLQTPHLESGIWIWTPDPDWFTFVEVCALQVLLLHYILGFIGLTA